VVRENRERERELGKGGECVDGKGVRGERGCSETGRKRRGDR